MSQILTKLSFCERYFLHTGYKKIVQEAIDLYQAGLPKLCVAKLSQLPTEKQLLENLIFILKGKSVYKTLKQIEEGKEIDKYTHIKALSSLMTHAVIECEKGNREYSALIPFLTSSIWNLL